MKCVSSQKAADLEKDLGEQTIKLDADLGVALDYSFGRNCAAF